MICTKVAERPEDEIYQNLDVGSSVPLHGPTTSNETRLKGGHSVL